MLPKHYLALSSILVGSWAQKTTETVVPETTEAPSSTLEEATTDTATGTGVTTHTINVGAAGHKFTPNDIEADVGDILEYRFYPDAHWVIRGDFGYPCIPYEYVDTDRTGFSSGPQPVKAITNDAPRFRVRVNNTEPIFYYCGAPGSCVKYHMMGVVNPSKNETLDDWLKKANGVDYQLTPGEPFPKEQGFTTSTTSASPESTTSTTPDATGGFSYQPDDENGLSGGAVAGIAIGGAAVLILATGVIYLCSRRGGFDKAYRKNIGNNAMPSYPNEAPPVVEAEVGSPNGAVPGFWVYKPMSPVASSAGQSPRTSPPPRPPKEELVASAELPGQKLAESVAELPDSVNSGS
ncbi:hypothetical protein NCS56_01316600 [Fusarium sp. Ph1]|nr:hypothetical protein NCS56_01316600 [Fusarium sp. Ph1]